MIIRRIRILSEAEGDLEAGRTFYANQNAGIGDYFWDSLLSDMESLAIFAGVHSKAYGCYRALSKRFPYAVYYRVDQDVATVIAVLPLRMDPAWIRTQLTERT